MRTRTIHITDYFARLASEAGSLEGTNNDQVVLALGSAGKRSELPATAVQQELAAAGRLGIVHGVVSPDGSLVWSVTATRLQELAHGALPQATEQLAAIMAMAAELLEATSYEISLDGDGPAVRYIDVFSTIYNAQLAHMRGTTDMNRHISVKRNDNKSDVLYTTKLQEAEKLIARHGLRRAHRVTVRVKHKELDMKKTSKQGEQEVVAVGSWRVSQEGRDYRLEWIVDTQGGTPRRIICALEKGSEAQRAAVETYLGFANRLLASSVEAMVHASRDLRSSFFGSDEPLADFVKQFAQQFLTKTQLRDLELNDPDAAQTNLLDAAETVACERCGSSVEQFGDYAICLQCGDAQFVR